MISNTFPLLPCAYKQIFGVSCPLCGFQRSIILLLQGHVWESVCRFPPLPILFLLLIITMYSVITKQYTVLQNKLLWSIVFFSLIANCIYQNIID
ncbi:MAG: DUF2752 domain-containing protein [Paludibacteraceae bacterium]|nr:DUF2752 domain-containing protein [Paludibacteraceae bacterium]